VAVDLAPQVEGGRIAFCCVLIVAFVTLSFICVLGQDLCMYQIEKMECHMHTIKEEVREDLSVQAWLQVQQCCHQPATYVYIHAYDVTSQVAYMHMMLACILS
jgi:hypothetical protein